MSAIPRSADTADRRPSRSEILPGGRRRNLIATLRLQVVLVALPLLVRGVFWALQVPANTFTLLSLALVVGNMANAVMLIARPLLARLKSPWRWIAELGVLAVMGTLTPILAQFILRFMSGWSGSGLGGSVGRFSAADVRVSVLVTVVVGVLVYGAGQILTDQKTKKRLEEQNSELQGQVQFGEVRRQAQEAELESANEIQMHLLPRDTPQVPGIGIACAWQPAKAVSGDYFDVFPLAEGRVALLLADVSGKGIGAALLMANLQASVRAFARDDVSPSEMCSRLNQVLCSNIAPGKFVTMFYGILDAGTKRLHFENAGHCLPLLVRKDGSIEMPASYSGVLGLFSHWTYQNSELQFQPGDALLIVTDGVLEAADREEEEYGYQRLISLVERQRRHGAASAHDLRKAILEDVSRFCEGVFQDDASLIVVTVD